MIQTNLVSIFNGPALCVLDASVGMCSWHYVVASAPRRARTGVRVPAREGDTFPVLPVFRLPRHTALNAWEKKYSSTLGRIDSH